MLVIPDKMSHEKILHLRALGAEVRMTRSDVGKGHPEYYQDMAERIAARDARRLLRQPVRQPGQSRWRTRPRPGRRSGSRWASDVDAVVVGVGSGGTLTGLGRYFARVSPKTEMVLADPVGSVLAPLHRDRRAWARPAPGWSRASARISCRRSPTCRCVKEAYSIPDRESMPTARELLAREGILAGSSSGTLLAAALRYCREQTTPKRVVTFVCDSGNKYLSKMFNDFWMVDQGLAERARSTATCATWSRARYRGGRHGDRSARTTRC